MIGLLVAKGVVKPGKSILKPGKSILKAAKRTTGAPFPAPILIQLHLNIENDAGGACSGGAGELGLEFISQDAPARMIGAREGAVDLGAAGLAGAAGDGSASSTAISSKGLTTKLTPSMLIPEPSERSLSPLTLFCLF